MALYDQLLIYAALLVAVVAFTFFLIWELTEEHPIVDLSLFTRRNFAMGTIGLTLGYGVFFGNLVVPPGAPGTDAYQTNRNLILNEGARADTIPFLEIETAEVRCSHAGAVGRVDDEQVFYLMSRGLSEEEAMAMIVRGFIEPIAKELPMEYAVELNRLIELQMEGSIG